MKQPAPSISAPPRWRVLDTPGAPGAHNMAVDAALMESVRTGAAPVLRFYRWSPPTLSLGRNQPAAGLYDEAALRERGIGVVRRPTGGRAVLHDRELTYSVVVPDGSLGSPRAAYAAINGALVAGLRSLGVDASLQIAPGTRAPVPSLAPCFRDPAEGEVVVAGRKLIGSAQYREAGVMLQHGSLLLDGDQSPVLDLLLHRPQASPADSPARLSEHLRPLPSWARLTAALIAGWREVIGGAAEPSELSHEEREAADRLSVLYGGSEWTWRR